MAKVISLSERDVIKLRLDANHKIRGGDNQKFLEEEYRYLNNRQNILKKQIRDVQLLSDNNIKKLFDEIKNSKSDKIKELLLADENSVSYSALNFLPKPPTDKKTGLPLLKKREDELKYINNLTNQELHKHYQDQINNLKLELKYIKKIIKVIKESSDNINIPKFKTLPTYNGLGNTTIKTQQELIIDLLKKNKSEDDKRTLEEILVKHVMDDKNFTTDQKKEILLFIKDNNGSKVLENCLMFPLTRDEKRILRTLREEIYEQIKTQKITGFGLTNYEAYISYDKFFTLYGVSNDDKTIKHIKDILFGRSTKGLHEKIIVECKQAVTTSLILHIEEKKEKINLFTKEVGTGFVITIPSFLFVSEDKRNAKDYYNQENEGYRRFMKIGKMAQSDAVSNIACKLEMLCHSTLHNRKKKEVKLNLMTMIDIAGARYKKRYKKSPTEIKDKIKNILDSMVRANYLIESWDIGIGKYESEGTREQYILKPLNVKVS